MTPGLRGCITCTMMNCESPRTGRRHIGRRVVTIIPDEFLAEIDRKIVESHNVRTRSEIIREIVIHALRSPRRHRHRAAV